MIGAALFFSLMSLLVKAAGQTIPSMELVLARGVVSLVLSYWLVLRAGVSPWGNRKGLLTLRGILGFCALSAFYFSLTRLPIAEATVLQYLSPLFTVFLAALFIGERLTRAVLLPTMICLIGVILVARPAFIFGGMAGELDPVAVAVALFGAIMAAAAYVTVRQASRTEHPLVIVFYFPLISTPAAIPFVISDFVWPHGWEWMLLLGVGVTTQIAQVYLTRGLALEPAGRAMTISYVQILFAAAWGALFFAEIPGLLSLAGSALVIGGTLYIALRGRISVGVGSRRYDGRTDITGGRAS